MRNPLLAAATLALLVGAPALAQAETTIIRRDAPDVVVERPASERKTVETRETADGCASKTVTKENDVGDRKTVTKEVCD